MIDGGAVTDLRTAAGWLARAVHGGMGAGEEVRAADEVQRLLNEMEDDMTIEELRESTAARPPAKTRFVHVGVREFALGIGANIVTLRQATHEEAVQAARDASARERTSVTLYARRRPDDSTWTAIGTAVTD